MTHPGGLRTAPSWRQYFEDMADLQDDFVEPERASERPRVLDTDDADA